MDVGLGDFSVFLLKVQYSLLHWQCHFPVLNLNLWPRSLLPRLIAKKHDELRFESDESLILVRRARMMDRINQVIIVRRERKCAH